MEKFRKVRAELANYIALISQYYKHTGFTVHHILGRSLVTSERLQSLPPSLQSPSIVGLDSYDRHKIESIGELAARLEKAWEETEVVDDCWRGLRISALDPFVAAEILRRASEAAELYKAVSKSRDALITVGILHQADEEEIGQIHQALATIFPYESAIQGSFVDKIIETERIRELKELFAACDVFREQRDTLSITFQGPLDTQLAEQLREMHRVCEESKFDTLDVEVLERRQNECIQSLKRIEVAECELAEFLSEVPELTECSIGELIRARRIIDDSNLDVLASRNEQLGDPAAGPLIESAVKRGNELKAWREKLARTITVDDALSVNEISEHASALRSASSLRFLSPRYRSARKTYKRLSRGSDFNRQHAAYVMSDLAAWRNEENRYAADNHVKTIFGIQYNGIDTNFEVFTRLLAYYRRVDEEFPKVSSRRLRRFLKTADLDLLKSMPKLVASDSSLTFSELGREIELQRKQLELINHNIATLRHLSRRIRDNIRLQPSELLKLADSIDAHETSRKSIEESPLRTLLGGRFEGVETARKNFASDLAVAELLLDAGGCAATVQPLVRDGRVLEALRIVEAFASALSAGHRAIDELIDRTGIPRDHFLAQMTYCDAIGRLEAAARDVRGLNAHASYFLAYSELQEAGMAQPAQDLINFGHGLTGLGDILEALIFRALSMQIYGDFGPKLARYNGDRLDDLRRQLADLDREIIENSINQLRATLVHNSNPPVGNGRGKKSTYTEMSLLNNEINKQRGFYPVRDLTRRAGNALLELKPCWMMSPLSIAQYLEPGAVEFDLCIVDEASQMPPENAIGALLRSRQVMVVGDTNQLPPTSFFRKMIEDEDADEDETVLEESILEMANTTFRPARRLRWHYRSRHSGLIRFCNRMIYDDDLIVFPSANENRPEMGVSLVSVEGTYKSGTNAAEASAIVEAAVRFMKQCPQRSLGIVVLNQKQRDLILEEMEYALNRDQLASRYVDLWANKNDGLESFFVKNLENVQGDERDVIFIGTVYGPATLGARVQQRFGPINGLAGKRRLNVLFSRAKQQIVTFSSMATSDINVDENGNPGAYMLKRWLEYAATGVLDPGITTEREPDSDFEIFVIRQLRAMGCEPVPQVGVAGYFIDIGVRHPEWPHGYLLGVECDGATYHSSKSARDRDRLRQEVLEGLGWHLYRIWSTDWFNDPRNEAEKLRQRIEERLAEEMATTSHTFSSNIIDAIEAEPKSSEAFDTSAAELPEDIDSNTKKQRKDLFATAETRNRPACTEQIVSSTQVEVGDTVRVRYLTGDQKTLVVTLSDSNDAPKNGLVHVSKPLGKALLGAEVEDQIEVLVGSRIRSACVEEIIRRETAKVFPT